MRILPALAVLPLAYLVGAAGAPAHPTPAAADPCASLNASTLGDYRNQIRKALSAATADARANGRTGRYAVAATNARDLLQRSYDRANEMVNFNQKMPSPNSTTYVEAGKFKAYLQSILKWLPDAAHWATISASYHRSQEALEAFNRSTDAIERGSQLMRAAGRCFVAPYLSGAVIAG